MEENKEEQDDELLALSSIFTEDLAISEGPKPGGTYTHILKDLPQPFCIISKEADGKRRKFDIQFLPEIQLHFNFPATYPSTDPPSYFLVCKWLKTAQLCQICVKLDEIWEEGKGSVILYQWIDFFQNELVEFLKLCSPLEISTIVPCKQQSVEQDADPRAIQEILPPDRLLAAILEFNTEQVELQFGTQIFTCKICFCEKPGKQCLHFTPCNHVFCQECLKGYFEVQIGDGNVQGLLCPEPGCDTTATPGHVKQVVAEEIFERYDRLLLQSTLDKMSDIMYCPRQACGSPVILDQESGSCASCSYVFCIFCKKTYHGVSPCKIQSEEIKGLREKYLNADPTEKQLLERRYGRLHLKQLVDESFSQQWLEENSKQCPRCKAHIQKSDGCNKMTCTKCRCYFCWLCGAHLKQDNPYSHFITPGETCYQQLFEGIENDDFLMEEWWQ
jgi:E3 ubiquitin-protein ligase RNF14